MKRVSNAYKRAIAKLYRNHTRMVVSIGIISNEAQASAHITSETSYLSNDKVFKNRQGTNQYATFEENVCKCDGSMLFPPENDEMLQLASGVGAMSEDILGSISVAFDKAYDIKGLTIDFSEFYPTSFNIVVNDTDTSTYSNTAQTWETRDNFDGVWKLTITPLSFVNGDNKRLRINSMLMGIGLVFQSEDISNSSLTDTTSFISEELPQIDFNINCLDRFKLFNVDDENSFIHYLQTGQELKATLGIELDDGSIEWVQLARTFLTRWSSDTKNISLSGGDRFRVYLTGQYEGGNYIHTRTAYEEAESILTDAGLEPDEYLIDDTLRNVVLTNPLPVVSHAEALQLVANAGRCALKQDADGRIIFMANFENIAEPTDLRVTTSDIAEWSKPGNIRTGSNIVYADFTENFIPADGSMLFMPESAPFLDTGFVSRYIADANGDFEQTPTVALKLPATFNYYGLYLEFAGNPPQSFTVNVYNSDSLLETFEVENPTKVYHLDHEFYMFDKIELVFDKGAPNNRIVLQKIAFASLTDYRLTKEAMKSDPMGTIETKIREIRVKVFTYRNETEEIDGVSQTVAKEVEDNVFYSQTLNSVGEVLTFDSNPLISTMEHAQDVAEWIGNYYANNITYQVKYRGDPRIESSDYIFMDSDVLNNLQVEVDSHTLEYHGALSGELKLRRAVNMIS